MIVSVVAALAFFAAPESAPTGGAAPTAAPAAEAKPAMERVCVKIPVEGSAVPKKKCVMQPVKTADKMAQEDPAKAEAPKPE